MGEVACCWAPRPRFAAPQSSQRVRRLTSVTFGETSILSRLGPASRFRRSVQAGLADLSGKIGQGVGFP
jgi:hypothetical protein